MQLMPSTAQYLGVTDPFDPEQNIMGGTKYLAESLKNNNGSVEKALAAYNAGQGNVDKYGGIPPFKETQNYVKSIMDALKGKTINNNPTTDNSLDNTKSINTNWWGSIIIIALTVILLIIGASFLVGTLSDVDTKNALKGVLK